MAWFGTGVGDEILRWLIEASVVLLCLRVGLGKLRNMLTIACKLQT